MFKLKYSLDAQKLLVTVLRAANLPPKDVVGTPQDVGVKCYMLPDKKKKFQTKVARKTASPEFDEEFAFNTTFAELALRSLQFVVFGFDRFSRQKTIGLVVVSNLVEQFEYSWETQCCRDIISLEQVGYPSMTSLIILTSHTVHYELLLTLKSRIDVIGYLELLLF